MLQVILFIVTVFSCMRSINTNVVDKGGGTPLFKAISNEDEEAVKVLLQSGTKADEADEKGTTPLHKAAWKRNAAIVRMLLKAGVDVNAVNKGGRTPLHIACEMGREEVVRVLLQVGADVNAVDEQGVTPLHAAASNSHESVVKMLLGAGAKVNILDNDIQTAICGAIRSKNKRVVELLLKAGAKVDNDDSIFCRTKVYSAASRSSVEVVNLLLEEVLQVNKEDAYHRTLLFYAASKGNAAVVERLLKAGATVNKRDHLGESILEEALGNGCRKTISMLVEAGAQIDIKAIYKALNRGTDRALVLLEVLAAEAKIDDPDQDGAALLHIAASDGNEVMVEMLLKAGAAVNQDDGHDATPLLSAVRNGHKEVMEILLKAGAKIDNSIKDVIGNVNGRDGKTFVHYLVEFKMFDKILALNLSSEEINSPSRYGRSVLHCAVASNFDLDSIGILLEAGCKLGMEDKKKSIPIDIALKADNLELFTFLYERMKLDDETKSLIPGIKDRAAKSKSKLIKDYLQQAEDVDAGEASNETERLKRKGDFTEDTSAAEGVNLKKKKR